MKAILNEACAYYIDHVAGTDADPYKHLTDYMTPASQDIDDLMDELVGEDDEWMALCAGTDALYAYAPGLC